jgi:hypothetical protein
MSSVRENSDGPALCRRPRRQCPIRKSLPKTVDQIVRKVKRLSIKHFALGNVFSEYSRVASASASTAVGTA